MPTALHKKWHLIPSGRPGERFRQRYHQHQKSENRGIFSMILRCILAAVSAVIGFILVFIPGPAVVFFLISGALLASDWLPVARLLDWGEVHVRRIWTRLHGIWKKMPLAGRVALLVAGAALGAATTYGFYRMMR